MAAFSSTKTDSLINQRLTYKIYRAEAKSKSFFKHFLAAIENIIKAGTFVGIKEVNHKRFKSFAYYKVGLKIGDDSYTAVVNIGIRENGDSVLYTINPITKGADLSGFGDDKGAVSTEINTAPTKHNSNITPFAPKSKGKNKFFSDASGESAHGDFIDLSDLGAFDNPDAADAPANDTDLHPVELPELVKIVKALLGKAPRIRRRMKNGAYGFARRGRLKKLRKVCERMRRIVNYL